MRFAKDWKRIKKTGTLNGFYNRHPHFRDLMKDQESMGHHLIVQQVYSDFNKARNYTGGNLLVGGWIGAKIIGEKFNSQEKCNCLEKLMKN